MTAPSTPADVVLVNMPWAASARPSLAVGLLQAIATSRGFRSEARYLNLDFATTIGPDIYDAISFERAFEAVGEHLFAVDLFGARALRSDAFLENPHRHRPTGVTVDLRLDLDALVAMRDVIVPDFLDRAAEELLASGTRIIGFSCVFNQVLASLALARRLKRADPGITILLGGGSVHGAMGMAYARLFPELLDHVFTGEADEVFPLVLEALLAGQSVRDVPGVTAGGVLAAPAVPVRALDAIPTPDYDSYFAERQALEAQGGRLSPHRDLPYESARGCWWGEKSHCTFCGLNNEGMASRNKSTDRVVTELTELASRYRTTFLSAADNILPHTGYRDLLPRIAELGLDFRLFYEIKANVTRDDIAALARAGVLWIQPGIESFSDHVLTLMRKGVTAIQNVQLLKWLQEFGITPYYNLLVGFPGETAEDFEEMLSLMPALSHLTPPVGRGAQMVQVHRFSPFFNEPERFGIEGIRPEPFYRHLIPPRLGGAMEYAYFFERRVPNDAPFRRYQARLDAQIARWRKSRRRLVAMLGPGYITIRRTGRSDRDLATLERDDALVFLLADAQTSVGRIARGVEEVFPGRGDDVPQVVERLLKSGVLVRSGERIVSVVPFERPRRSAEVTEWIRRWLVVSSPRGPRPQHDGRSRTPLASSPASRTYDLPRNGDGPLAG